MKGIGAVREVADQILRANPDPLVRFRLLRDVLREQFNSDRLGEARIEMLNSQWIQELKQKQRKDGSWGRFRSAARQKDGIVTTEAAVERGWPWVWKPQTLFSELQ